MYLIVGGDGSIGKQLGAYWSQKKIPFHSSTRKKHLVSDVKPFIDLNKLNNFEMKFSYDAIIFCIAISKLEECESQPTITRRINVSKTYELCSFFSKFGSYILFISSNQVFGESKPFAKFNDNTAPLNEYGRQKLEAEYLISGLPNYGILRLTKVVHPECSLFLEWYNKLDNNIPVNAFVDLTLSPVSLKNVIVQKKENGIYQCSGDVDISYYNYALKFAKQGGIPVELIRKSSYKKHKFKVARPKFTSLTQL